MTASTNMTKNKRGLKFINQVDANYNAGPRPSSSGYVAESSRTRQKRPSGDTENGPSKKPKPCAAELPFLRRLRKKLAPGSRPRLDAHNTQELQCIASPSSSSGYPMYPDEAEGKEPEKEQPNKMTTKVKSRLTRANRGNTEEVAAPTPVELPTSSLQLDQDNLSMSSFSTPTLKLLATSTPKTTVNLFSPEIVSSDPLQVCLEATPPKYTFKTPENTTVSKDWQCSDCWVKLKPEANNCTVPLTDISETDADWKCEDCWISNKSTVDKCVACGGARLGVKQNNPANVAYNTSSFFGSSDDKFKTFIQSQESNKWECFSYLVNHENDKDKCACCGAAKESKNKTSGPNFGTVANSSFKSGIDPKVEDPEATIAQKLEVNSTIQSKVKQQSGTNNVLAETPTFTFTLATKQVDIKADSKGQLTEAKINLTFILQKAINTDTDTKDPASFLMSVPVGIVFYFGENAQEVPSVDLNSLATNNENKTLPPAVNSLNPLAADAKKDLKVNSVPSPVVPDAEKPNSTFSFVVNAPKLNLLTEMTTSAPTLPLFEPPAATTVPNPSIPSFEAPSLTQPAEPAFNFSTSQSTGIFGFRQQGPLQQQQMQSAPLQSQLPAGRRLHKAFRRIPQR